MKSSALFSVRIFRTLRSPGCRAVLAAWLFIALLLQSATAVAPGPAWWSTQTVLDPYSVADDFAAANTGQLKYMAAKAAAAMEAALAGGAGSTINTMVSSWSLPPESGVTRDNYLAINQGQLKHVATPFYDRLGLPYPWAGSSGGKDNYKLVNLGQLKNVFSFALNFRTAGQGAMQIPSATLAAALAQWQALPVKPAGSSADDFDGDGISNLQEYLMGSPLFDPLDIDGDRILDSIEDAHPGVLSKLRFADAVADYDGDGVMNFEEVLLGLNLSSAATSGRADGLSDALVLAWGLAAHKPLVSSAVAGTDAFKTLWGQIDAAWITANVGNDYLNWLDTTLVSGVPAGLSTFRNDVLTNLIWQPWNPGEGSIQHPSLAYDANWNPIDMDGDGVDDFDRDGDYLSDLWEYRYAFNLRDNQDGGKDPDGDTLTNLQEYQAGTNPRLADSDGDGFADGVELAQLAQGSDPLNGAVGLPLVLVQASGNFQSVTVGMGSSPLVVQVTQGGLPVRGVQVQFAVSTGGGNLRGADAAAATGATLSLTTDTNGTASVVYLAGASTGIAGVTATLASGGSSSVYFTLTIAEPVITYTYGDSDSEPSVGAPSGYGNSNPGPVADPQLMADSKSMYAIWEKWTDAAAKSFFKSYGNISHLWDTGLGIPFFDLSTDQTSEIVRRFNAEPWHFYGNPTDASGFLYAPIAVYAHSYSKTTDGPWYQPTQETERQTRQVTALKVVTYVPQKEPPEMRFLARVYLGDSGWVQNSPSETLQISGEIRVKGSASTWSSNLDAYCSKKDGAVIVDPGPEGGRLIAKTDDKYIRVELLRVDITVRKKGDPSPTDDRLLVKVGDTTELMLADHTLGIPDDKVTWSLRQLKIDGSYDSWTFVGNGEVCEILPLHTGVYQVKAEVDGQECVYRRKTNDSLSSRKMGDPNAFGVYVQNWQKEVLDQAKSLLGSTAYKTTGSIPSGDPLGLFTGRNKCNTFVADMLEQTSVEIDPPINGVYLASPPSATNWAGIHETSDPTSPHPIPGWKLTSDDPSPGYVTATGYASGSSGHCGIVDFDGQWISAGPVNVNRKADFVHYTSSGSPASQRKR